MKMKEYWFILILLKVLENKFVGCLRFIIWCEEIVCFIFLNKFINFLKKSWLVFCIYVVVLIFLKIVEINKIIRLY